MSLRLSTGLRNALLGTSAFKTLMDTGVLVLFSGAIPSNADLAESGVKLAEITVASGVTGLSFGTPAAGAISKNGDVWSGVGLATGTAGYYVFYNSAHVIGASSTSIRFMGTVGVSGCDLNMSNTTVTQTLTTSIDAYTITLPAS